MRHFFKFIAVFLPFSFTLLSEEEIEIVKVEVATVIWKDQATSEKFEIVDENVLIGEALSLEKIEKPEINLEAIVNDKEEIVFDFEYFEEIPEFIEEDITYEEVISSKGEKTWEEHKSPHGIIPTLRNLFQTAI